MNPSLVKRLLAIFHMCVCCVSTLTEVNIGAMFNLQDSAGGVSRVGVQCKEAILMAFREVNNKTDGMYDDLLPTTELRMAYSPHGYSFSSATVATRTLGSSFGGLGVRANIGPDSNTGIAGSVKIFAEQGALQIAYQGDDDDFSLVETYPNFVRTNPSAGLQAFLLASFIYKTYGWERVAIIHSYNVWGYHVQLRYIAGAQYIGASGYWVHTDYNSRDYEAMMKEVKATGANIYALFIRDAVQTAAILKAGWKLKMFGEGTHIVAAESATSPEVWQNLDDGEMSLEDIAGVMKGFTAVREMVRKSDPEATSFISRWRQQTPTVGSGGVCDSTTDDDGNFLHQYTADNTTICAGLNFTEFATDGSDIDAAAMYAYDATILLAKGVNSLLHGNYSHQSEINFFNMQTALDQVINAGVTGVFQRSPFLLRTSNDRMSNIAYGMFTFDPELFLQSSKGNMSASAKGLIYTGTLDSSSLVYEPCIDNPVVAAMCETQMYPTHISCACSDFIFDTKDNTYPFDRPHVTTVSLEIGMAALLWVASVLCIVAVSISFATMVYYEQTRMIRILQPELVYVILLGGVCASVTAILASLEASGPVCISLNVMCHLSFIFIFSPLLVKTLRIYLVLNSGFQRKKVSLLQTMICVLVIFAITTILLSINIAHVWHEDYDYTMLTDNQFERTRAKTCPYMMHDSAVALLVFETLILFGGVYMCYLTRDLPSGISDAKQVANAIFGIILCCLVGVPLYLLVNMKPFESRFLLGLLVVFGATRTIVVLYFSVFTKLLQGYDLDKTFKLVEVRKPVS